MAPANALNGLLPATADSAHAVMDVYSASLTILIPLGVAFAASVALRHARAAARVLVWRAAVVALLAIAVGRLLPTQWVAWVVPAGFASPLVTLGRLQVGAPSAVTPLVQALAQGGSRLARSESIAIRLLFLLYGSGVVAVAGALVVAAVRMRRRASRAIMADDPRVVRLFDAARARMGVRRSVRVAVTDDGQVPTTWGMFRPIILLPRVVTAWDDRRLHTVFLHELAHVRALDSAFGAASRIMCAIFWFHPGAWVVDRRLHADCELACDDRVLDCGVRPSDYAELLATACDRLLPSAHPQVALAVAERTGLRGRLAAIVDPLRDRRPAASAAAMGAMLLMIAVTAPASVVQLAPTRAVLDTLMQDTRWESRAYAVLRLASRADSVEVARSAATFDPSPEVRAWARYALSRQGGLGLVVPSTGP